MFMKREESQNSMQSRNTFTEDKGEEREDRKKSALLITEENMRLV